VDTAVVAAASLGKGTVVRREFTSGRVGVVLVGALASPARAAARLVLLLPRVLTDILLVLGVVVLDPIMYHLILVVSVASGQVAYLFRNLGFLPTSEVLSELTERCFGSSVEPIRR